MSTDDRLAALERSNRRWKLVACLLLLCVAARLCIGAGEASPPGPLEDLVVKNLTVVNGDRRPVMRLSGVSHKDGGFLGIYPNDARSKASVSLYCAADGGYVFLYDPEMKPGVSANSTSTGSGVVVTALDDSMISLFGGKTASLQHGASNRRTPP